MAVSSGQGSLHILVSQNETSFVLFVFFVFFSWLREKRDASEGTTVYSYNNKIGSENFQALHFLHFIVL